MLLMGDIQKNISPKQSISFRNLIKEALASSKVQITYSKKRRISISFPLEAEKSLFVIHSYKTAMKTIESGALGTPKRN